MPEAGTTLTAQNVPAESSEVATGPTQDFFAPVKGSLATIITLSVIGVITSIVPFLVVVELARMLRPAMGGATVDTTRVWVIVAVAAGALIVSFVAAFASGTVSHFADAELQLSLRRRLIRHLQRLPLGWFDTRSSGSVRKLVENDVTALHHLVAHAINDVITAIAVPVLSLIYLFVVQWQFALAIFQCLSRNSHSRDLFNARGLANVASPVHIRWGGPNGLRSAE